MIMFFSFQISASINLAEEAKDPKFIAETTWELEMWFVVISFRIV